MAKTSQDKKSRRSSFKDVLTKVVEAVKTPFKQNGKMEKTSQQQVIETTKKEKAKKEKTKRSPSRKKQPLVSAKKKKSPAAHPENSPSANKQPVQKTEVKPAPEGNEQPQQLKRHSSKKNDVPDVPFAENTSNVSDSRFFYSNDKFIDTFEDQSIYEFLQSKHKDFTPDQSDAVKRSIILQILDDEQLMSQLFEYYDMNILDFLKFLFRLCPSVFKGFFISKIQSLLKNKSYLKDVRFARYTRPRAKASAKKYSFL